MRLLCWLRGHKWFYTVATEHDSQKPYDDMCCWYRGIWHERICTRCGHQEAVYQKTVYSWCFGEQELYELTNYENKPTEHYSLGDTWRRTTC